MMVASVPSVRPELVEGLLFSFRLSEEGRRFDKLSANGEVA